MPKQENKIKTVESFQTTDGKVHRDLNEANLHQSKLDVSEYISSVVEEKFSFSSEEKEIVKEFLVGNIEEICQQVHKVRLNYI